MKQKTILVASVVSVVLFLGVWHFVQTVLSDNSVAMPGVPEQGAPNVRSESATPSSASDGADGGKSEDTTPDARQSSANKEFLENDAVAVALRSTAASGALDALLPAIQRGDARAMLAHRSLIGRCSEYRDGERFWPTPTAEEGSADWLAQRQAIAEEGRYCGTDPRLQDPLLRGARSITQRLNDLARNGDPEAMAFALGTGVLESPGHSEEQLALDLLKGNLSPDARQAILEKLVTGQIGSSGSDLGSELFARMQVPTERQRLMKQLAVAVYGCELGADCRAFGAVQNQFCIAYGSCAPHLTLDQFILTRYVAPQEAQVIRQLVAGLRRFPPPG